MEPAIKTDVMIIGAGPTGLSLACQFVRYGTDFLKAGDRMPYFLIDGESIYDRLREPKLHLVIFSDGKNDYQEYKKKLENEYRELIGVYIIPLYPQVAEVFGANQTIIVLLRPDNHIGFVDMEISPDGVKDYLREFIRHS